jgi:hypothetical protein
MDDERRVLLVLAVLLAFVWFVAATLNYGH